MFRQVGAKTLAVAVFATLLLAGAVGAQSSTLTGTVGPDFTISLTDASGAAVKALDPGAYTVNVSDLSINHSFHLEGPGVERATEIETTGDQTWEVSLVEARYRFYCDAHPETMRGDFVVGNPPPPPPPPATKLRAKVGPGATISLVNASGARVKSLIAVRYAITVRDLTRRDNFHLKGPGVNRKTGVAQRTTVTWRLTLRAGTYRYFSDAHPKLKRSVLVKPKPRGY